ncbi:MAG: sigma-70 family RNA polymerase sigma factor, partial [Anaerolineales bacterium]|nr:sigma-70 family RNA polymerase sigma factor [Anaerolineales bacterium]
MAQPSNPDLQLVQKAVNGNRKAFTTLFNRYFQSVYNFALMLSRNPAMAEDLTQEAFIRAHAKLDSLGPPWNFRAWIFRLTRNYFIDQTRKDREVDPLEEGDQVISPSPTPEKETMSREVADRVHSTLSRMSVQHREILVLRELNEFSYGEIGEILDISSSNVKVSLHRARAAFQESYGIQLLLEDPTGDCQEVAGLLHAFHDNEELRDQEHFVKEHLKVCEECQKRRQLLITQSVLMGAFIPVIPPNALKQRILQETASPISGHSAPKSGKIKRVLGFGGATTVLVVMGWLVFSLIFNTKSILPNFPGGENGTQAPVVLAPAVPTESVPEPPPPPPQAPPSGPESSFDRCTLFEGQDISLVLLNIPAETMQLPLYFKIEGGIHGLVLEYLEDAEPWEYSARLGSIESYKCDLQGFDDRLYCMFTIPTDMPGTAQDLSLFLNGCAAPVIFLPGVSIPEPLPPALPDSPECNKDL